MSLESIGDPLPGADEDEICRYCGDYIEVRDQRCPALGEGRCEP